MDKEVGVSIILPTYNREKEVVRAIDSILKQTYSNFELIIVDDGSVDETEAVIKNFHDERIVYHKLEENQGQSKARNYGIKKAKYDYLAFQESDDFWRSQKLELQMNAMLKAEKDVGIVYHKMKYDMGNGTSFILPDETLDNSKKTGDIYPQMLWDNLSGMPAILVKKSCAEKVGYLDESLRCLEDYDFALRLTKEFKTVFLDEILLDVSFSNSGVSGNSYQYLIASCVLVHKYKQDYIATNTLSHRLEIIIRDAERMG